jgi:hypothetical protein
MIGRVRGGEDRDIGHRENGGTHAGHDRDDERNAGRR